METLTTFFWQVLPLLLTVAIPTLLVLVTVLCKKFGLALDAEQKAKLNTFMISIVSQGITYAEQMAKKSLAENQTAVNGSQKMYMATQYVIDELKKNNITNIASTEIAKKVESLLGVDTIAKQDANIFSQLMSGDIGEEQGEE